MTAQPIPDTRTGPTIIHPDHPDAAEIGGLGVEWKLDGALSEGRFSIVHHPLAPRALAAPLHYHHAEDEFSFVLEGTLGALLGDHVVTAGPGTWVAKPRGEWHTFWNAGDTPCRIIEVISPAGFEEFFREMAASDRSPEALRRISERYRLEMKPESVPELCERFGLRFPLMEM